MKIAIDARFYRKSTGGIGRYTRALLRELVKLDKKNKYTIYLTKDDDREYDINAKNFSKKIIDITHYSLNEQTKFLTELNCQKFDLVHFTNFNHPLLYRGKFIITIHDLTLMLYPPTKKRHSFAKKIGLNLTMKNAVNKAQKIIAVSQATKKDIVNVLNAKTEKIEVIYEGIDPDYRREITNYKLQITNEVAKKYNIQKPYLLFVSQWRPHKGILGLIKAFEILKKDYPTSSANRGLRGASNIPHKLVIVGKPNSDFPEIPLALKQSSSSKDITTPGFIDEEDLPEIYRQADLFVFPSHYEGFGLGPLEAMACGTAVVSSNTSCMPEILGNAAIYFDPFDPQDMAEKINLALFDKKLRSDIIVRGLARVKKYSWKKMAKETLAIYRQFS